MKITDFHTHIFPEKIAAAAIASLSKSSGVKNNTDGTVNGLLKSMDIAGITRSVVLPVVTNPKQFTSVNRYAEEINRKFEDRIISFGGIHPLDSDYKQELKSLKESGFKGIKLHPDYQGVNANDISVKRIVYEASALGLIITIHAGKDISFPRMASTAEMLAEVTDEIKPDKFVLAHLGSWGDWQKTIKLLCGKNIWLDISFSLEYIKEDILREIVRLHGADRILFATDSPWSKQSEYVEKASSLFTEDEQKLIMCKNAENLLYGRKDD